MGNFCKDCRHKQEHSANLSFDYSRIDWRCAIEVVSALNGQLGTPLCEWARLPHMPCGPEGKLFQPREAA